MKDSIHGEYFRYMDEYQKKYGKEKTIVIMQVGSFYTFYFFKDKGGNMNELADILNLQITRITKKKPLSSKNPNMIGFPEVALAKYLKILLDNGYLVVQVDQVKKLENKALRKVTAVHTSGMHIDNISAET